VKNMRRMMLLAIVLGMAFATIGLWLSYFLNLTSGATIILVSGGAYLLSMGVNAALRRVRPEGDAAAISAGGCD